MIDKLINIDNIISVNVYDKHDVIEDSYYFYYRHKKGDFKRYTLNKFTFKKLYYQEDIFGYQFDSNKYTRKEVNKFYLDGFTSKNKDCFYVKDNILYEKPYAKIIMVDKDVVEIHRDTLDEVYKYLRNLGITKYSKVKKV